MRVWHWPDELGIHVAKRYPIGIGQRGFTPGRECLLQVLRSRSASSCDASNGFPRSLEQFCSDYRLNGCRRRSWRRGRPPVFGRYAGLPSNYFLPAAMGGIGPLSAALRDSGSQVGSDFRNLVVPSEIRVPTDQVRQCPIVDRRPASTFCMRRVTFARTTGSIEMTTRHLNGPFRTTYFCARKALLVPFSTF